MRNYASCSFLAERIAPADMPYGEARHRLLEDAQGKEGRLTSEISVNIIGQDPTLKLQRPSNSNPQTLGRELAGLKKYQVRQFRIVYEIDRKKRMIKIFAIDHRLEVYVELAERFRHLRQRCK